MPVHMAIADAQMAMGVVKMAVRGVIWATQVRNGVRRVPRATLPLVIIVLLVLASPLLYDVSQAVLGVVR